MCTFPAEVEQSTALPPHFSSHTVHKCLFHSLFSAMIFVFFGVLSVGDFAV